jgi:polar amino acid transport system substrate-binding protein
MAKISLLRWSRIAVIAIAVLLSGYATGAAAGALDQIRERGVLVVGTKGDYQPFGFRDGGGAIVGFEPDLASEIAQSLGIKVKLVPVVATNRLSLLASGDIDLVIATMNDTPERRKQVDFVEPSYYASGVNVLVPKSARLRVWQQLRGKPACTVDGVFYIAEIKERYDPELHILKDVTQAYQALKAGDCLAAVYDDAAIIGQLQLAGWRNGGTTRCRCVRS